MSTDGKLLMARLAVVLLLAGFGYCPVVRAQLETSSLTGAPASETQDDAADSAQAFADAACRYALHELPMPPHRLEEIIAAAVQGIRAKSANRHQAVLAVGLAADLEKMVGPLEKIPSITLHQALAGLARVLNDEPRERRQWAIVEALLWRMERRGQGEDFETALQPCLIENEYGWLALRTGLSNRQSQTTIAHDGRQFDVLEIRDEHRNLRTVYFDISPLWDAYSRWQLDALTPDNDPKPESHLAPRPESHPSFDSNGVDDTPSPPTN